MQQGQSLSHARNVFVAGYDMKVAYSPVQTAVDVEAPSKLPQPGHHAHDLQQNLRWHHATRYSLAEMYNIHTDTLLMA